MDWRTIRRSKLARAAEEGVDYTTPETRGHAAFARFGDAWERFWAFSPLERGMVLAGGVLAAIAAPIAIVALLSSGGGGGGAKRDVPAVINLPGATSIYVPPTATQLPPLPTPTAMPTTQPDRQNCDEIAGTEYRSETEREWYIINCSPSVEAPQPDDVYTPPVEPPPSEPPAEQPSPEPQGLTAGDAIGIAVDWMRGNTHGQYQINSGSCAAASFGSKWVVSCNATLAGCGNASAGCNTTLSACVLSTGAVRPTESC